MNHNHVQRRQQQINPNFHVHKLITIIELAVSVDQSTQRLGHYLYIPELRARALLTT